MEVSLTCQGLSDSSGIHALFSFQAIRTLRLEGELELRHVTDEAVGCLAHSLSRLEVLAIIVSGWDPSELPRLTAKGLLPLLRHCTAMTRLTVPVDLSDLRALSIATSLTSSTALLELTLCQLVLPSDITRAAQYLANCCPKAARVQLHELASRKTSFLERQSLFEELARQRAGPRLLATGW